MTLNFSLKLTSLFVVMKLSCVAFTSGEDLTLEDGASGAAVVHAVITKLRTCEMLKNTTDHRFLRRTAYVESRDGKINGPGGIWRVNDVWIHFLNKNHELLNECTCLNTSIDGCQLSNITMKCTEKPLYSGLVISFYLYYSRSSIPLSSNINEQAKLWNVLWYNSEGKNYSIDIANLNEDCKVNKDIFFALDVSRSIHKKEIFKVKTFLKEFVDELTIGLNDDRVGIIVYGNDADIVFNLSSNTNKTYLLNAIEHNVTNSREATNTADALCKLQYGFKETRKSTTVLKIAIFMTDGHSTILSRNNICHQNTLEAAAAVHNLQPPVLVYAIGVSDNINRKELEAIATNTDNYYHIDNFNGLKPLPDYYIDDICWDVAVNISNEGMINETLESEVIHYVLTIPYLGVTIQVCAIDGIVQVYGSVTYSNPNSALNNCSLLLDNTECQNVYIPPNKNSTPGHVKRSVEYQTSTENVLYITVEGASIGNNSFTMNMTEGDIPDDCVGERVATDCESITQNDADFTVVIIIVIILFIILSIVPVIIVCVGHAVNRYKKKQTTMEEDSYKLLDNEYHIVENE